MIPWKKIDQSTIPGGQETITLQRRGDEYSIRTAGIELMNSRQHGSEDALATLACEQIEKTSGIRMLIGGLGMGYTLAAALKISNPDTKITVAELIPAVANWNREHLGHLAQHPTRDSRVQIKTCDVADKIHQSRTDWDAILLDVDNGPEGLTQKSNDRLYTLAGLKKASAALSPGGILAVWSCAADVKFTARLKQAGFVVQTKTVRARTPQKGARHVIWLAKKR